MRAIFQLSNTLWTIYTAICSIAELDSSGEDAADDDELVLDIEFKLVEPAQKNEMKEKMRLG